MEERRRRFSTVQQISPDTLKVIKQGAKRLDAIDDIEEGHVETPGKQINSHLIKAPNEPISDI